MPPSRHVPKLSVSEPVTRTPSVLFAHTHSSSQPSRSEQRSQQLSRTEHKSSSSRSLRDSSVLEPIVISDDSWEQGMSAVKEEEELQDHSDLQNILDKEVENDSTEKMSNSQHSDDEFIFSPSLGEYPLRSRRRERSQTAPQPINESSQQAMYAPPLRRNQMSPLHNTAQLDALQHAYAVITDMGTSQVDVQDIMQAKRLAHQISQMLDDQMCAKFGGARSDIQ